MTTTTGGVFGQATAFCAPGIHAGNGAAIDHLGSIRRHLQGVLVQGGQTSTTMSPLITITALRSHAIVARTAPMKDSAFVGLTVIAPQLSIAALDPVTPRPVLPGTTSGRTIAQDLVDQVRTRSGLVLEEIASLLRTSRRTLQNWKAGEAISTVNERRLRDLAAVIDQIAADDDQVTRRRLLDRCEGCVSAYDLLAEGRYDAAVALVTGAMASPRNQLRTGGLRAELASRLNPAPDIQPIAAGVLSARRLRHRRKQ